MYDYVIVGAGSAGCVLAARLSADRDVKVCLVEAGAEDDDDRIHIPVAGAQLRRTQFDWDYDTHIEPFCNDRRICLPRGRVLGGTSSISGMVYMRGNRSGFDDWGQPGWTYGELLPYFKRAEDNERGPSDYHGTGGPLSVSDSRSQNPSTLAFVDAAVEAGFPLNDDFNGATQEGFGPFQVTQHNGRRCSTAVGYLRPALNRPNLTVLTRILVHRIMFENGRAIGVLGTRGKETLEIRAAREVIIAAGAYNSPQLLQLSGVGSAALLGPLGIPITLDQPHVGQNLQDHTHDFMVYTHSQPISLMTAGDPETVRLYATEGRGPLASNGPEAGGFTFSGVGQTEHPDLQFHALPVMFVDGGLGMPTAHGISFGADGLRPQSRGSVEIVSSDPTAKPKIRHNYFAEQADMDAAVAGLRITMEIARQNALKPYTENVVVPVDPDSTDEIQAHIRRYSESAYHPAGTCAMGTVVDSELRVVGLDGLRVVDASVMPTVFANPNAPIIAIAEKAADLIRGVAPLPAQLVAQTRN